MFGPGAVLLWIVCSTSMDCVQYFCALVYTVDILCFCVFVWAMRWYCYNTEKEVRETRTEGSGTGRGRQERGMQRGVRGVDELETTTART